MTPSRWALLGGLVAAIAALAALVTFAGPDTAEGGPIELAHVHGLAVDPGNGDLYAGSHYGLIRLPEQGEPTRVADRVQDFMGFTVVGPQHFLASGHPGADQEGPSNVGLIESTDGGRSWDELSLGGQADFHTLEARHGLVYGSNAGRLMVSADGRNWENRATLPMADLAISPENAETLLATTQQGLARSTDGGRTFGLLENAPLLQLITWTDTGTLLGLDPDGAIHASTDGGASWQQRGTVNGAPEALTAAGNAVHVATENGIVSSTDGGRAFQTRYATD
ncbi:MAG: exo-alpha-sialidase [Pseudonocardiaceae bacterium]|nr:exo-alpha-sialidase [Pseudonocardiaceae bacterium]